MRATRAPGFTLVEVMVVAAMIAALASIAIPVFHKLSLRAKAAERVTVMGHIKKALVDYYVQNGTSAPAASGGVVVAGFNPPMPPLPSKRAMQTNLPGWNTYFSAPGGGSSLPVEIAGGVYYSYDFRVQEAAAGSAFQIFAAGDLDGDGVVSWRVTSCARAGGLYRCTDLPAEGLEDDATYGTF
jgi:prepilin-type N-terminal cleavage/methylation domain-containing protein